MTLRDLIDELSDLAEDLGDDIEVRLAHQPRWPFEYSIDRVVGIEAKEKRHQAAVVYIGEGGQLGYLPGCVSYELGWSDRAPDEDDDE